MNYVILGPHPGSQTYSIAKYFNFYRRQLPGVLPDPVVARCPGAIGQLEMGALPRVSRRKAWWENYALWPLELARQRAGCFHIVDQGLMWYARFLRKGRIAGTVHDLIAYMIDRGTLKLEHAPLRRKPIIAENIRQLRQLEVLISVSQHTADLLMRELEVPSRRIRVIHNHLDPVFAPLSPTERIVARARFFSAAEHAVIHVGKASAYKNRLGAMKAFSLLWKRLPGARMFLVHGPASRQEQRFLGESGCATAFKFLPPLEDAELREFYGAADALIFPSFYEGFGWPPLEAMAMGCPAVSATSGSLGEIAGDGALTFDDPNDHAHMADLLHAVLTERGMASDLRRRGLCRARKFAPEIALARVAEVYRSLA